MNATTAKYLRNCRCWNRRISSSEQTSGRCSLGGYKGTYSEIPTSMVELRPSCFQLLAKVFTYITLNRLPILDDIIHSNPPWKFQIIQLHYSYRSSACPTSLSFVYLHKHWFHHQHTRILAFHTPFYPIFKKPLHETTRLSRISHFTLYRIFNSPNPHRKYSTQIFHKMAPVKATRKRKSEAITGSINGQKIHTIRCSPERSPIKKRKLGLSLAQKQALIDNLQLESTDAPPSQIMKFLDF